MIKKILATFIILFSLLILSEVLVNYFACVNWYVFPIKNSTSFGFIERKTGKVVIPLNKYNSRLKTQLALPFAILKLKFTIKDLYPIKNENNQKYGYVDKNNKLIIDYKYSFADNFKEDYAVVALLDKYGTIDKQGNWIIKPKYIHLCTNHKYYIKACIDYDHCGALDRFGNELTKMTYNINKLNCAQKDCLKSFCEIGENKSYCK